MGQEREQSCQGGHGRARAQHGVNATKPHAVHDLFDTDQFACHLVHTHTVTDPLPCGCYQDVKPASNVTGRPNSLQLKTSSGGSVCYITDTETELVEWMSAIEGAVQRICRHAAGEEMV